jgi:hypothetical protein
VVNVSCLAGQHLKNGQSFFLTVCSAHTEWVPDVPEYIDDRRKRSMPDGFVCALKNESVYTLRIVLSNLSSLLFYLKQKQLVACQISENLIGLSPERGKIERLTIHCTLDGCTFFSRNI